MLKVHTQYCSKTLREVKTILFMLDWRILCVMIVWNLQLEVQMIKSVLHKEIITPNQFLNIKQLAYELGQSTKPALLSIGNNIIESDSANRLPFAISQQ